jgi:hypothetical protein
LIRGQKRIERHRHDARAHRAKKHSWEINRVEHDHRHALFAADAEPAEKVGDAERLSLQLAIGQFRNGVGIGQLVGPTLLDVAVEQIGHRVISA